MNQAQRWLRRFEAEKPYPMNQNGSYSPWRAWGRKLQSLARVARREADHSLSPDEFSEVVSELAAEVEGGSGLEHKLIALWGVEHLAYSQLRLAYADLDLRDPRLPQAVLPMAHVGLGMAAVQRSGFDPVGILRLLERHGDPRFSDYAFDGIGASLAAYSSSRSLLAFTLLNRLEIFAFRPLRVPRPAAFFDGFHTSRRAPLSHGFGRFLYFQYHRLENAWRSVGKRPYLDDEAAQRGVSFACMMVNAASFSELLTVAAPTRDIAWADAWEETRLNAAAFLEWVDPGCLRPLATISRQLSRRQRRAARRRAQRAAPPFELSSTACQQAFEVPAWSPAGAAVAS